MADGLGGDGVAGFDVGEHVEAEVGIGAVVDAAAQLVVGDAGSARQQLAAAVAAIGVDGYAVGLVEVEGPAVGHAEDAHTLSDGLGDIDLVADARRAVEVIVDALELGASGSGVLVAAGCVAVAQQQQMVGRRLHLVRPEGVGHLQKVAHLAARQQHGVEHVLVTIEVEHVAHIDVASLDGGVQREGGGDGDVGMGDVELHLVDEVHEGAGTEVGVARRDGLGERADALGNVFLDELHLRGEGSHEVGVGFIVEDGDVGGIGVRQGPSAVLLLQRECQLRDAAGAVGGVDKGYDLTLGGDDSVAVEVMVVAEDDGVEAGYRARHLLGGILGVCVGDDAAIKAAMEDADDDVGLLVLLHVCHPFAGRRLDICKLQFAPKLARQPVGDGGGEHADEG